MADLFSSFFSNYWPHILAIAGFAMSVLAGCHAILNKSDARAAVGWVGVVLLSPILGPLIYLAAGINRIRRDSLRESREAAGLPLLSEELTTAPDHIISERFGRRFQALRTLGDRVTDLPLTTSNRIEMLLGGDEAYTRMLAEIDGAERSVLIESYIFDNDHMGQRFVGRLAAAQARGVEVRVLIDAVGVRYSLPAITRDLARAGIPSALFNGRLIAGLRLPYANLRTHRKLLIIDGKTAFTGGLNIREHFTSEWWGDEVSHDTHFRVAGPVVGELLAIGAGDWAFAAGERLSGAAWALTPVPAAPTAPVLMRAVASGPDDSLGCSHRLLMGAFSTARRSIRIQSPYFLPDRELTAALTTAALRGVTIDILVPGQNNLAFVDRAMRAQFDQLLVQGCRIWRSTGAFDHSKLLCVDNTWSFVGSTNLDPRSLRLNFEVDLEVYDAAFSGKIAARIQQGLTTAEPVTLESLARRPFLTRLIDRTIWLASPYL
ncbi:phospholipase D-like domain-containing protein [Falsigemmobacter faecalis]|uniref:Phospholipase D n=1 Tax=Falsigemmobacter faecalis TaxID=2488730 RepID=A0A3P3DWH2_9RHOB|nr:phospholipase D-like domain-containing protein [Falsigemmobacter faecalis]RRH78519.1 cardiolipin synthase [Falsigemmobacter faecalis]